MFGTGKFVWSDGGGRRGQQRRGEGGSGDDERASGGRKVEHDAIGDEPAVQQDQRAGAGAERAQLGNQCHSATGPCAQVFPHDWRRLGGTDCRGGAARRATQQGRVTGSHRPPHGSVAEEENGVCRVRGQVQDQDSQRQ